MLMAKLATGCLNRKGKKRPNMREVSIELEKIRSSTYDSEIHIEEDDDDEEDQAMSFKAGYAWFSVHDSKQGVEVSDLNQSLKEVSGLKVIEEIREGFEKIGGSGVLEQGGGQTESVQESKDQISGGSKGSWVGAVQGHKFLKKYDVEVKMKDGIGSVTAPEEITKDVPPLWDDFLVGKFLDNAPHIAKVQAIVKRFGR